MPSKNNADNSIKKSIFTTGMEDAAKYTIIKEPTMISKTKQTGYTLIEIMITIAVLAIAFMALLSAQSRLMLIEEANNEDIIAMQACETMVEELRNESYDDFDELYFRYNGTDTDDPVGFTSPGDDFAVAGLQPQAADSDGMCGQIDWPDNASFELDETLTDSWWDPNVMDFNSDGDSLDSSLTDYTNIQVRVRVRYLSATGQNIEKDLVVTLYGN